MAKKSVTADEIMKARDVDLLLYLEAKGEQFKKEGAYYRHVEHDSLVIKDNMYAWNSRSEKGYGAINFAKMFYGMTFVEAVQDINNGDYPTISAEKGPREQKKIEPFVYPVEYEVKDRTAAKDYLVNERKIDERLVNWLFDKDLIAQDQRKNIVFKWREQGRKGEVVGADRQGTTKMDNKRGSFKQILPNGKQHSGFTVDIGKPETLYFFESPIDMLSYWSIQKGKLDNARLRSMNGLKFKTLFQSTIDAKKEGLEIKKVVLGIDNDKGGHEFIKKLNSIVKWDILETALPPTLGDDWNNELKKLSAVSPTKIRETSLER
ncbi:hypothetical protein AWH48_16945 [Domibacillus aminovorans]|uniref:DUF3991 domain-containing protein n=1 Tax=Domibacillus aminovorans TaxID=29332 RepID=A0A177L025_9BACI|nr:DUF3991 domain-containing protein [Domibacillus aminovorans]OAH58684.1 hypothetical protein AWH48_16945 [Domibacillus aminovorans]